MHVPLGLYLKFNYVCTPAEFILFGIPSLSFKVLDRREDKCIEKAKSKSNEVGKSKDQRVLP